MLESQGESSYPMLEHLPSHPDETASPAIFTLPSEKENREKAQNCRTSITKANHGNGEKEEMITLTRKAALICAEEH